MLANGQIKDMACRTLLSKLELQGYITLPRRRSPGLGAVARSLSPMFYIILLLLPVLSSVLKPVQVQLFEGSGLLLSLPVSAFPVPLSFVSAARSERT